MAFTGGEVMSKRVGFCVLYRFKIRPGAEDSFRRGWARMTGEIRDTRGGLGSRLHLADDGWWFAYAQWPDRAAWDRSQTMAALDTDAEQLMRESVEERLPPILLEPNIDLLAR
jgi:quinol monooxygenase YgiN